MNDQTTAHPTQSGAGVYDPLAGPEKVTDQAEQSTLALPSGIGDVELWRGRIVALLTAAETEGLLVPEIRQAVHTNFGEWFGGARIEKWLTAEMSAGTVIRDDADGMWYTVEAADRALAEAETGIETEADAAQPLMFLTPSSWSLRHILRGGRS